MITKFKLFENNNLLDELVDGLSLNLYKGRKRDDKKSINYKQLKIIDLESDFDNRNINGENIITKSTINIKLSNKDTISGEYVKSEKKGDIIENSIKIDINDKTIYHLNNENFDNNELINYIITLYKKYISKKWKIK